MAESDLSSELSHCAKPRMDPISKVSAPSSSDRLAIEEKTWPVIHLVRVTIDADGRLSTQTWKGGAK